MTNPTINIINIINIIKIKNNIFYFNAYFLKYIKIYIKEKEMLFIQKHSLKPLVDQSKLVLTIFLKYDTHNNKENIYYIIDKLINSY